jgi:hypothetical protein
MGCAKRENNSERALTSYNSAEREITSSSELQRLQSCREELQLKETCGRRNWCQKEERSSRNTQYQIDYSVLLSAVPIMSISKDRLNKHSSSLKGEKYAS